MNDERAIGRPLPTRRSAVVVAAVREGTPLDAIDGTVREHAVIRAHGAR